MENKTEKETAKINWFTLSFFSLMSGLMIMFYPLFLKDKVDFYTVFAVAISYGLIMFVILFSIKLFAEFDSELLYFFGFPKFIIFLFSLFGLLIVVLIYGVEMLGILTNANPKDITNYFKKEIFYSLNLYYIIFLFTVLTRHKVRNLPINFNGKTYYPGEKFVINPFLKFEIKPIKKELRDYFVFDFCCEDGNFRIRINFLAEIDFWEAEKMDLRYIDASQTAVETGATIRKKLAEMCPFRTLGEFIKNRDCIIRVINLSNPPVKITQIKFEV